MRVYVKSSGETINDAREISPYYIVDDHDRFSASDAASFLHDQCDYWEVQWPIELVLVAEDGTTSEWWVERHMEPTFEASRHHHDSCVDSDM